MFYRTPYIYLQKHVSSISKRAIFYPFEIQHLHLLKGRRNLERHVRTAVLYIIVDVLPVHLPEF